MTKPTKWSVHPAKTQISLGVRYPLSGQQRPWSDWADAQADLSLCWAHTHFVGFVMSWLINECAAWCCGRMMKHKSHLSPPCPEQDSLPESYFGRIECMKNLIRAVAGQRSSPELSFANKTKMFFRAKNIRRKITGQWNIGQSDLNLFCGQRHIFQSITFIHQKLLKI